MSANVNPVYYQSPIYPMYGVTQNGQNKGSYQYLNEVLSDLDMAGAELKVRILTDKIKAPDTTNEQKRILQSMLNDANKELLSLKQKNNIQ